MRAFRYRLAAVLKRAQHIEQILQIELARLQDQLARALHRLDALHHARDRLHTRLRLLQRPPAPDREADLHADRLARLLSLERQLEQLDDALVRAAFLRRELEHRVAAARSRLLDASRSRQVFENHRDGLARTHRRAELAAETKRLDELATTRFTAAERAHPDRRGPAPTQSQGES